ncbi:hypothetical protein QJS04_geneDACA021118 [Acorus gramineus]|uniref:Uncharacterized protein n=1 Tax=Acorus gramineus TaxID=55184 RepID=A0AAV9BS48_ACOGR|nr:hypothetical protein QJS04_geneDACA021118 [Acorus gramineus]
MDSNTVEYTKPTPPPPSMLKSPLFTCHNIETLMKRLHINRPNLLEEKLKDKELGRMDWKVTLTETVGDSEAADVADPTPPLSAIDGCSDEDAESCNLNAAEQEFGDDGVDDELDVDSGGGGDDDVETGFWGTWTTERFASEFVPMVEKEEGEEEGEVVQGGMDAGAADRLFWEACLANSAFVN